MKNRELLTEVWGYSEKVESRTVATTVGRIRAVVEEDATQPRWLLSRYGSGYMLVEAEGHVVTPEMPEGLEAILGFPAHLDGPDHREMVQVVLAHSVSLEAQLEVLPADQAAHIAAVLCHLSMVVQDYEPPMMAVRRAIATAPDGDRACAQAALYIALMRSPAWRDALAEATEVVDGLPRTVRHRGEVMLRFAHARLKWVTEDPETEAWLKQILKLARLHHLRYEAGLVLTQLGTIANQTHRHKLARQYHLDALRELRPHKHRRAEAVALHNLAVAEYSLGRLVEARDGITAAIEAFRTIGAEFYANFAEFTLASIELNLGHLDRARELGERALSHLQSTEIFGEALAMHILGQVDLAHRDLDAANLRFERAAHLALDGERFLVASHACRHRGASAVLAGEMAEARSWLRQARTWAMTNYEWADALSTVWLAFTYPPDHATRRRLYARAVTMASGSVLTEAVLAATEDPPPGRWTYDGRLHRAMVESTRAYWVAKVD